MKTAEYVKKYDLQNPEIKQSKAMRTNLLKDLAIELEQRILEVPNANYKTFHNAVKAINQKFWAISNKKIGPAFSFEYWNAFYALHVIALRKKYFPKEHAEMEKKGKIQRHRD